MIHRIWTYIWSVVQKTWEGWQADDGFLLSAAMAYYAAFSLFPLCLVLIAILGYVLEASQQAGSAQGEFLEQVRRVTSPWLADQLQALLAGVRANAGLGGPLGAVTLLAAAIVVFLQLDYMFGRIFGTPNSSKKISWWGYVRLVLYDRLSAFLMLLAVGGLMLSLFVANLVLTGIRSQIEHQLASGAVLWTWAQSLITVVTNWTQLLITLVTNAVLISLIYKILPKAKVLWRDAFAGGLLVSLVWFLGQRLLVTFLIGPSYTAYGIVGSFIAVMIWVYYISVILFLGAEFVEALAIVAGRSKKPTH
jgi:membrane protein